MLGYFNLFKDKFINLLEKKYSFISSKLFPGQVFIKLCGNKVIWWLVIPVPWSW